MNGERPSQLAVLRVDLALSRLAVTMAIPRTRATLLPLALVLVWLASAPSAAAAEGPGYVTIMFGRTQWAAAASCSPLPGAVDLGQIAQALAARGLVATGNVVTNWTQPTGFRCFATVLQPGWDRLAMLRDTFGWTFVSAGRSHRDLTKLTPSEQVSESCGSLGPLYDHGHDRAWGLFAYPKNRSTTSLQAEIVSTCFAYGRRYAPTTNDRSAMAFPWFQKTHSLDGGACNDPALSCWNVAAPKHYESPVAVRELFAVPADHWYTVQFYQLVEGRLGTVGGTSSQRWDCTSADWHQHWTSRSELYCFADFLAALDGIPPGVVVTDPASVAEAWGRVV